MKLKSVLTGSAAAATLMAASAANASGYYVSVFGGLSTMDDEFNVHSTTAYKTLQTSAFTSEAFSLIGSGSFYGGPTLGTDTNAYNREFVASYQFDTVYGTNDWTDGFENGYVVGGSLGWDFGTGWRSELELAFRANDVDGGAHESGFIHQNHFTRNYTGTITVAVFPTTVGWTASQSTTKTTSKSYSATNTTVVVPTLTNTNTNTHTNLNIGKGATSVISVTSTNTTTVSSTVRHTDLDVNIATSGDITTWSYMANVWYDFDLGNSRIHPFIGGGIGLAQVDLEYKALAYTMDGAAYTYAGGDDDWGFAYQLGAGLGYEFDNGMTLTAQYRYFATGEVQAGLRDQPSFNVESQNFLIGLQIPIGN